MEGSDMLNVAQGSLVIVVSLIAAALGMAYLVK
jgi:hypothetical protein